MRPRFAIACLDVEESVRADGFSRLAGLDEVGRGCWAGPVYAAAVILPSACYRDRSLLAEVTDSKLLTAAKRERLSQDVLALALGAAIGWAEAPVIDRLNILGATRLAMQAALEALQGPAEVGSAAAGGRRLTSAAVPADFLLIDALRLPQVPLPQRAVVRGDRSCLAIAAASIVAKVARDADITGRSLSGGIDPAFALAANKGYGTRRHLLALRAHGLSPLHRRSFAPVAQLELVLTGPATGA